MGCLSGCKVTLIAFVWFFSPMHFHMCFHVTCLRRCILTLFAFLWPKTTVLPSHCNFYIVITFSWIILIHCHYINFLTEKTYFTNQVFIERDRLWKWKFLLYKISSVSHFIGNILKNSAVRMITTHHSMLSLLQDGNGFIDRRELALMMRFSGEAVSESEIEVLPWWWWWWRWWWRWWWWWW